MSKLPGERETVVEAECSVEGWGSMSARLTPRSRKPELCYDPSRDRYRDSDQVGQVVRIMTIELI